MPKTYEITQKDAQMAREYMKKIQDKKAYRRLEVIALRGKGLTNTEIVKITKFSPKYVPQIVSLFIREGVDSLLVDKRRGGNRQKVTKSSEEEFLKSYEQKATHEK